MDSQTPTPLPVLALDDAVLLPGMSVTMPLLEEEQIQALESARDGRLVVVPRFDGAFTPLGVVAQISGQIALPDGTRGVALEALHRAELGPAVPGDPLAVEVRPLPDPEEVPLEAHALAQEYRAVVEEVAQARGDAGRVAAFLRSITHPGRLADTAGYAPEIDARAKAEILAAVDVVRRLELAVTAQRQRLAEMSLRKRIREDVAEGLEKAQKEAILRRQMEAIRKELDEDDPSSSDDWRARIEAAGMPDAARREAERELGRLERQSEGPEAGISAPTWSGWSRCRGTRARRSGSTSPRRAVCSMRTTRASRRSRSASWSTWPCAGCAASATSTTPAAA